MKFKQTIAFKELNNYVLSGGPLTFGELYQYLQKYAEYYDNLDALFRIIGDPGKNSKWHGKELLESLFRLFAVIKLFDEFKDYKVLTAGSFNNQTIREEPLKEFLKRQLNDSGDKSDLTFFSAERNEYIVCSVKNKNKVSTQGFDLQDLEWMALKRYASYNIRFVVVTRDAKDIDKAIKNARDTSIDYTELLKKATIFDKRDINRVFKLFINNYCQIDIPELCNITTEPLRLRFHQYLTVMATLEMSYLNILWGHIPRSGKSYIMAGVIYHDSVPKDTCNYLIITLCPKETINAYLKMFDSLTNFKDFAVVHVRTVNGKIIKPKNLSKKNIFIVSKHLLQHRKSNEVCKICGIDCNEHYSTRKKPIKWLSDIDFDWRFVDEAHYGGTTGLSKKIYSIYGKVCKTVFITATYCKPIHHLDIPKEARILWDLESVQVCKLISREIDVEENTQILVKKYGDKVPELIRIFYKDMKVYEQFPELHFMYYKFEQGVKKEIMDLLVDDTGDNGFSTESLFLLKSDSGNPIEEFLNEDALICFTKSIFGNYAKSNRFSIRLNKDGIVDRMCSIADKYGSRTFSKNNPLSILAFMPHGNSASPIDKVSNAWKKLIEKHGLCPNFEIVCANSKTGKDPKKLVDDAYTRARINPETKGILILTARQLSMGVSLDHCDVTLMLNNMTSLDLPFQMMFRCLTESPGKKMGFIFDFNIQRIANIIVDNAIKIHPTKDIEQAIVSVFEQRIINFNQDEWGELFDSVTLDINEVAKKIYEIWNMDPVNNVRSLLKQLVSFNIEFENNEKETFHDLFSDTNKVVIKENVELGGEDKDINKGIKKIVKDPKDPKDPDPEDPEYVDPNFIQEVLTYFLPIVCLLDFNNKTDFNFITMMERIENTKGKILYGQLETWWKKEPKKIFNFIKMSLEKYLKDNDEFNLMVKRVKKLFIQGVEDQDTLIELVDEYLIPTDKEQQNNAEFSTPKELRTKMLSRFQPKYWETKRKVLEPCSGKGHFLIEIVKRFMVGLKKSIPDPELRYKTIVEECIYFIDINPTNIYICKLLLDPFDKYTLNCHEGDSLKMKWPLKFDLVVGNPPFNSTKENTKSKSTNGNSIYHLFVKHGLKQLKPNGCFVFVHPPGWRKTNSNRSVLKGLFKLMAHDHQIIHLEMYDAKAGKKTFNAGTKYDWYLMQNKRACKNTTVIDEKGVSLKLDLRKWDWLPNYNIQRIQKITGPKEEGLNILFNSSYHAIKLSKVKDKKHKYTCVHSTPKKETRFMYSSYNDKGHFEVPKLIFGESGINKVVVDLEGKYGMTQGAMGIVINDPTDPKDVDKMVIALESAKFKEVIKACIWGNFRIDWNLLTYFKKDFWKEFQD